MRLLVTGASGFLGRNFLLSLDPSWTVDAVYLKDNNFPGFLARSGLQHVSLHRCDLSDAEQVRALADVLPKRFDTILYLAADPSPVTSKADPAADSMSGSIGFTTLTFRDRFIEIQQDIRHIKPDRQLNQVFRITILFAD